MAWIELSARGGSSVSLTLQTLRALDSLREEVERLAGDGQVRALAIGTTAPFPTLSGYDVDELRSMGEGEISAWSDEAQGILRRLEQLPVPSVAAIQGAWLGGGVELALACSFRIGADSRTTSLGLPQTRFGFLPAWGGTVRLPRLVGLRTALQLVLSGDAIGSREASELGLLDGVVSRGDFAIRVERWVLAHLDRKRPRRRSGRSVRDRLLDDTAPGRRLVVARAARRYVAEAESTRAVRLALELVSAGVALPLERAFALEADAARQLIVSADARGRLHSERFTDRALVRTPPGPGELEAAGVLGAGQTGSDLAHLLASAGIPVRIKDVRSDVVREGVHRVLERLSWETDQGRISRRLASRRSGRVRAATGFGGFGTLDLLVAAPDGPGVEELLREAEPHVREDCVLAYCDPSIPPTPAQRSLRNPERVVGVYPSFPLERFSLLEIIPGALTSPETVSACRRLARRLSMTPVIIPDHTPPPGARLLGIYLAEATRLLEEGASVTRVDRAAEEFGFAVGPFHRMDAIGTRRSLRFLQDLTSSLGERMQPALILQRVASHDGRFYRYRGGVPIAPGPGLPTASPGDDVLAIEARERLLLLLVSEAVRVVADDAVRDPGDLEVVSIVGLGFPRERGGLLFHAEDRGLAEVIAELERHATVHGERFAPPGLLRELASAGGSFFGPRERSPSGHGGPPMLE